MKAVDCHASGLSGISWALLSPRHLAKPKSDEEVQDECVAQFIGRLKRWRCAQRALDLNQPITLVRVEKLSNCDLREKRRGEM
jgi:hypothetical protein